MTKIICFEGVDGSGKTTQIEMLAKKLSSFGKNVQIRSYPVYESFFGLELGKLLSGKDDLFKASDLDSKSMALWYAMDRWKDFVDNKPLFAEGDYLILNRYTLSNVVYQSLRTDNTEMMGWVDKLEHTILGLPRPDIYILLDVIPRISRENILSKEKRPYIDSGAADVYEGDMTLQERAWALYLELAQKNERIEVIHCYDENSMLSLVDVHKEIMSLLIKLRLVE